ncbi:hypothetical protein Clacol_006311 [Clathrus columnatus]|uniref:t-SNARE coiled-coil homology domain-containing protein n=1 Tax=Clathrus columnatus TaxID=1419009 RepID=A0AAV5AJD6_9AGAM|nr:hypothetical protein Clacol_006311 [Clathrus columnatus]
MARDRLAGLRAQQGNGYSEPEPVPGGRSYAAHGRQDDRYEMTEVNNDTVPLTANGDDTTAFFAEIDAIKESLGTYNNNVTRISELHQRALNSTDENVASRTTQQLETLVAETSSLSSQIKLRITNLQRNPGTGQDGQFRRQQTARVKQNFMEAIQNYQQVESQYRTKYKQRLERQFKIVKPDATDAEVKMVVDNDTQGNQIFTQALQSSNRYGESRTAYREVQERHEDIKRIERTLTELAQLFNDMSILVEQQDESINAIQTNAGKVEHDTEIGYISHSLGI